MNKLLIASAIALTGFIATSAMAAPEHRYNEPSHSYASTPKHADNRWDHKHNNRYNNQKVNPSRQWRVGQFLPQTFHSPRYKVSDRDARRLPNAGRNQQWYKINGDYVLVNERTDRILRIVG